MARVNINLFTAIAVIAMAATPAFAQQDNTGGATSYYAPLYNTSNSPTYYSPVTPGNNGARAIYNNGTNVPPVPMKQMIAGRNAPSYTFGGGNPQPYAFNNNNPMAGVSSIGSLSPQQASYLRAQQAAQAQAQQYNNGNATQFSMYGTPQGAGQYGTNTYQPQMTAEQMAQQQAQAQQGALPDMSNNAFNVQPQQQQQQPKQRKVVYKERNNPLSTPPRLFNPDQ